MKSLPDIILTVMFNVLISHTYVSHNGLQCVGINPVADQVYFLL